MSRPQADPEAVATERLWCAIDELAETVSELDTLRRRLCAEAERLRAEQKRCEGDTR